MADSRRPLTVCLWVALPGTGPDEGFRRLADCPPAPLLVAAPWWPEPVDAAWVADRAGSLARRRQGLVVAGVWSVAGGRAAWLADPSGSAGQWQTHAWPRRPPVRLGDQVLVRPGPRGGLAVLVGADTHVPEVSRLAVNRGARWLVFLPDLPAEAQPAEEWWGPWARVQELQVWGVVVEPPPPAGPGRQAVLGPCEATADQSGFLWSAAGAGQWLVPVVAEDLDRVRADYPLDRLANWDMYRRQLPPRWGAAPLPVAAAPPRGRRRLLGGWPLQAVLAARTDLAGVPPARGRPAPRPAAAGDRLRVAAVQLEVRPWRRAGDWAAAVAVAARQAAAAGARLVAFPEDVATGLLALVPGLDRLGEDADLGAAVASVPGLAVGDLLWAAAPALGRLYRRVFSQLARELGVWLAAGTLLDRDGPRVVNRAHLFGPDGRLLARQDKTQLIPLEEAWGIEAGREQRVVAAAGTRLGLPVCMDATYAATTGIIAGLGAEVVVFPQANPEPYHVWKARRGPWPRVQESLVYAVVSCLVGRIWGLELAGRSAVLAPLELTPAGDGVLAAVDDPNGPGLAVADLDLVALRELRRTSPRPARPELYRAWLADLVAPAS